MDRTPEQVDRVRDLRSQLDVAHGALLRCLTAPDNATRAEEALQAVWALSYVAAAVDGGALPLAVDLARTAGASWADVGAMMCRPAGDRTEVAASRDGVSKQAAAKRFGAPAPTYHEPGPSLLDDLA